MEIIRFGMELISYVQRGFSHEFHNFAAALPGHKSRERIQKKKKQIYVFNYFNSKCEHQAAAIQTCVSDSASEKSATPQGLC